MKVFVANLGYKNVHWPTCRDEHVITLQTTVKCFEHWQRADRVGWIDWATHNVSSLNGRVATPPVASRWFNLISIIFETTGDLWIHRADTDLFWTHSFDGTPAVSEIPDPFGSNTKHVLIRRRADAWQNLDKQGRRLQWKSLHPKAHDFLHTEATYQELANDRGYRDYARALVAGDPLDEWYGQSNWKSRLGRSSNVRVFSNLEKTIWRAVNTIESTVAQADGRIEETIRKVKQQMVSSLELREYLEDLYRQQEELCAATGLRMLLDGDEGSADFKLSVDRIDSNGHYEPSNLQLVCQFANFWKSHRDDKRFKELIAIVRQGTA